MNPYVKRERYGTTCEGLWAVDTRMPHAVSGPRYVLLPLVTKKKINVFLYKVTIAFKFIDTF